MTTTADIDLDDVFGTYEDDPVGYVDALDLNDDDPFLTGKADEFKRLTEGWTTQKKASMLRWLKSRAARNEIKNRYSHPAELAQGVDPNYLITPAIEVISKSVEQVLRTPRINLLVTMPPQEGKSSLCAVWSVLRALQLNPDLRVIVAAYGDTLAEDHSRECLRHLASAGTGAMDSLTDTELPDKIGLQVSSTRSAVSGWRVEGGKGGMVAVGLSSSITGRPADLMIIDDPYKNMQEADSAAHRRKVEEWFKSVALTRLSADASVILIQTRWHPEDLAGMIIAAEAAAPKGERTWRHLNIPAVAEDGVPDALDREPGEAMISARGRTPQQFHAKRRSVGERVWYALFQGVPDPPGGDLFKREWFTEHRLDEAPERTLMTVVGVDPAETGEGDEAGIVAASLTAGGVTVITHDWSGQFTSDQWSRRAVELAMTIGAREIAVESYTAGTTYSNAVKTAYKVMHRDAVTKYREGVTLSDIERRCLSQAMPFKIVAWRGKGDAIARSALIRQGIETGRTKFVGEGTRKLEDLSIGWQSGQHQPDRLAAAIVAHDRLVATLGRTGMTMGNPMKTNPQRRSAGGSWMTRKITG